MELTERNKNEILQTIQVILSNSFNGSAGKQKINVMRDRLNFSCPFCGDSHDNAYKKRGNLYYRTLFFHCYNCAEHCDIVEFFKVNDVEINDLDKLIFYLDYIKKNQIAYNPTQYMESETFENLQNWSVPIIDLKNKLELINPQDDAKIIKYLKSRFMQNNLERFLYHKKQDRLYLLNLTKDKTSVIGFQMRTFKESSAKYISYNIEKLNQIFERNIEIPEEELMIANTISLYFNITDIDFSKPTTIFEGPMDAFSCKNSIAICGLDKPIDMFKEIPTIRYFFDNDVWGKRKMEGLLKSKKSVFMWNKLLKDYKVTKKVKDFNDLIQYCWVYKNDALKNWNTYFTNNPLDIRNV